MNDEEYVRLRAYQLWVQEGRPEGRDHIHWQRARRELEQGGQAKTPRTAATQQAGENPKKEKA
jgi:hypothetical protein